MTSSVAQTACACSGCAAAVYGNIWLASALTSLLIIAIALDFYHIWQRCKDREKRIQALLSKHRKKEDCKNGGCCS